MIRLTLGQVYKNKTYRYLAPIVNAYSRGELACFFIIQGSTLAYTIGDEDYLKSKPYSTKDRLMFVLIDANGRFDKRRGVYKSKEQGRKDLAEFLKELKKSSLYYDDYPFETLKSDKHVAVLKFPDYWDHAYQSFIEGKYSKMYSKEDLNKCMIYPTIGKQVSTVYQVLTKDPDYEPAFREKIQEFFHTNHIPDHFEEYDLPLFRKYEILNYKKTLDNGRETRQEIPRVNTTR